jgi:hypothetical protein
MAKAIIAYSKNRFCTILMPNMGRLVKNNGSRAQCMAQAKLVLIPIASQLILNDIPQRYHIAT